VKIILASASPRRVELLSRFVTDLRVVPSEVDEQEVGSPKARVLSLARKKVLEVAKHEEGIIIGADTLVLIDGEALGKPRSREHAKAMLKRLSGREHVVLTGLYVLKTVTHEDREACEETVVRFRWLDDAEVEAYLETEEYLGKAGAYAIQGRAGLFIEEIRGDFSNVVGLPLCRLSCLLKEFGATLLRS
jgi:septum formation protein